MARASAISAPPSNPAPALIRGRQAGPGPHFGQRHPWSRLTSEYLIPNGALELSEGEPVMAH